MTGIANKAELDLATLKSTVGTVSNLLAQLLISTKPTIEAEKQKKSSKESTENINVLHLSHDAASLLKAHSTKISLLIINKPFTPTAVCTVLREIASGPLPALASSVELCDEATYTHTMAKELTWRVHQVLVEFGNLLQEIPLTGEILTTAQKNGSKHNKGSLASTGVLWKACDELMGMRQLGIAGLVILKANSYRATLQDALEELQEWGDEEDEDEDEDEDGDDDDDVGSGDEGDMLPDPAQKAIDDMFANQRHIPKDDTNKIRERLESTLKRVKLITLMITAVIKRRFKTLPALPVLPHPQPPPDSNEKLSHAPQIGQVLDEVLRQMKKLTDVTDELANGFYELDTVEIDKRMDEVFFTGFAAAELLLKNWEGHNDEFTTWIQKFQLAMKRGW